jgi:hypothetical protein
MKSFFKSTFTKPFKLKQQISKLVLIMAAAQVIAAPPASAIFGLFDGDKEKTVNPYEELESMQPINYADTLENENVPDTIKEKRAEIRKEEQRAIDFINPSIESAADKNSSGKKAASSDDKDSVENESSSPLNTNDSQNADANSTVKFKLNKDDSSNAISDSKANIEDSSTEEKSGRKKYFFFGKTKEKSGVQEINEPTSPETDKKDTSTKKSFSFFNKKDKNKNDTVDSKDNTSLDNNNETTSNQTTQKSSTENLNSIDTKDLEKSSADQTNTDKNQPTTENSKNLKKINLDDDSFKSAPAPSEDNQAIKLDELDTGIDLNDEEISAEFEHGEKEQLLELWRATLLRNRTIQFIIKFLGTDPNAIEEKNKVMQSLTKALFVPFYTASALTRSSVIASGASLGARVIGDVVENHNQDKAVDRQLSRTDMVVMFMLVDEVAERVRTNFYSYKDAKVRLALINKDLETARADDATIFAVSDGGNLNRERILSQLIIRDLERKERVTKLDYMSSKRTLVELAGKEAVDNVEPLIDAEIDTMY